MGGGGWIMKKVLVIAFDKRVGSLKSRCCCCFFSVHETRSLAAGILGHGLRTLADGVFCKFTGKQKSYRCLDLS